MKIAVISDIHANLPALQAVIADFIGHVEHVICLGDVVNYGPWNDECLQALAMIKGIEAVRGNHEELFLGLEPINHENRLVQLFYQSSICRFTRADLIEGNTLSVTRREWSFTHTINGMKLYQDTPIELNGHTFVGHTHHQFDVTRGAFRMVNPGSVGQNRKRLDLACYAVFDEDTEMVEMRQVRYDVRSLLAEMRDRGYPPECLAYYESKLPIA